MLPEGEFPHVLPQNTGEIQSNSSLQSADLVQRVQAVIETEQFPEPVDVYCYFARPVLPKIYFSSEFQSGRPTAGQIARMRLRDRGDTEDTYLYNVLYPLTADEQQAYEEYSLHNRTLVQALFSRGWQPSIQDIKKILTHVEGTVYIPPSRPFSDDETEIVKNGLVALFDSDEATKRKVDYLATFYNAPNTHIDRIDNHDLRRAWRQEIQNLFAPYNSIVEHELKNNRMRTNKLTIIEPTVANLWNLAKKLYPAEVQKLEIDPEDPTVEPFLAKVLICLQQTRTTMYDFIHEFSRKNDMGQEHTRAEKIQLLQTVDDSIKSLFDCFLQG